MLSVIVLNVITLSVIMVSVGGADIRLTWKLAKDERPSLFNPTKRDKEKDHNIDKCGQSFKPCFLHHGKEAR